MKATRSKKMNVKMGSCFLIVGVEPSLNTYLQICSIIQWPLFGIWTWGYFNYPQRTQSNNPKWNNKLQNKIQDKTTILSSKACHCFKEKTHISIESGFRFRGPGLRLQPIVRRRRVVESLGGTSGNGTSGGGRDDRTVLFFGGHFLVFVILFQGFKKHDIFTQVQKLAVVEENCTLVVWWSWRCLR